MTKRKILQAIQQLSDCASEKERDDAVGRLIETAPHARLSDLVYYPERERTHEEIADEALLRERVWSEQGEEALRIHIENQLLAALSDASVPGRHHSKVSARMLLSSIRSEE